MDCPNCGKQAKNPVTVVYADEAHAAKQQTPFQVCGKCFERDETVPVAHWVPDEDHPDFSADNTVLKLEEGRALRYRKVDA